MDPKIRQPCPWCGAMLLPLTPQGVERDRREQLQQPTPRRGPPGTRGHRCAPPAPPEASAAPAAGACARGAGATPGTEDPSPSAAAGGD